MSIEKRHYVNVCVGIVCKIFADEQKRRLRSACFQFVFKYIGVIVKNSWFSWFQNPYFFSILGLGLEYILNTKAAGILFKWLSYIGDDGTPSWY
jgi:hypothetical protein